jgi:hypothetical protein
MSDSQNSGANSDWIDARLPVRNDLETFKFSTTPADFIDVMLAKSDLP